ncbi:bifunctional methionine sulfoxide reductase B/A protein [Shewanella dokdonensis]|uniref:bifunctional methionine sulfoxide reductase B/A protein n=1 Tax=Shewanella dokdonensis TaxID=712036 RepID=UPI0024B1EA42|nr:bifunctional methionine sulfoxide reductase B/A protein [Shewanella dokdonensis]
MKTMLPLDDFERYVIEDKGTERPFSGQYYQHAAPGRYLCRKCGAPLYLSEHKFQAHCGWPAFDDELPGAVARKTDADGQRTEILCANCGAHLGHVFAGEYLTPKNLRHCVNSVSMVFEAAEDPVTVAPATAVATFGGGCFWCTEAVFKSLRGVLQVTPGYAGGEASTAHYRRVCNGDTGHAEVVQLVYDPAQISYEQLLEVFFAAHDPTTLNRQGNDVGTQYRSVIFAHDAQQIATADAVIKALAQSGEYRAGIVTELSAYQAFYPAEVEHLDYYAGHQQQPYCSLVIGPKLEKICHYFADWQKNTEQK